MATFRAFFNNIGETSSEFAAMFSGGDKGYTGKRFVSLTVGSRTYTITGTNTSDGSGTSFSRTITGLSSGTRYNWSAKLGYGSSSSNITWLNSYTDTGSFTTDDSRAQRPNNWSWYSSISSGGMMRLTALEWNDFTERVNDFRAYKGLSKYSFTKVSRGMTITASIVNQAIEAIKSMNSATPSRVYAGDTIYAAFFNNLKNALNNIT